MARRKAISDLIDEQPPASVEAERALIGSLLVLRNTTDTMQSVEKLISPSDFYDEAHRIIHEHAVGLADAGKPVDIILLVESLKKTTGGDLSAFEHVGGSAYLATVIESTPNADHARHYASVIRENELKRQLRAFGEQIIVDSMNGKSAEETVETIQSVLGPLLKKGGPSDSNWPEPVSARNLRKNQHIPWVIKGYVALGYKTLLVGGWKAGKTTYLTHACCDSCRNPSA